MGLACRSWRSNSPCKEGQAGKTQHAVKHFLRPAPHNESCFTIYYVLLSAKTYKSGRGKIILLQEKCAEGNVLNQSVRQSVIHPGSVDFTLVNCSLMWFLSGQLDKLRCQDNQILRRSLWNHKGIIESVFRHMHELILTDWWTSPGILISMVLMILSHIQRLFHRDGNDGFLSELITWVYGRLGHSLQPLKPPNLQDFWHHLLSAGALAVQK